MAGMRRSAVSAATSERDGRVELRQVSKFFETGSHLAVDRADLDIVAGEFMTLLGPSGSGKSTTLNMIAGFERATSGEILIGGTNVDSLPPYKRGLGMVFQHYALFPHLTVLENIAFPLRRRKVPKAEALLRSEQVLELVGLAGYGKRRPRELSGGQQQRVALARAVVFNPPVLLMDEPLGALDKNLRGLLQREISRMHQELGITFIFVTHDQEEALALSDRIAVFNDGRIEQIGTAEDLYERPASVFVAEFLGDSNLFHGTLGSTSRGHSLRAEGLDIAVNAAPGTLDGPHAVMVRPEKVTLSPHDITPPGDVSLSARISDVVYLGSQRKIRFTCDNGMRGTCLEVVGSIDGSSVRAGDRVHVSWNAADAVLLANQPKEMTAHV
ncbi:MAG: transporter ATP-binding protein [Aeromicrobium sp.]|nr:transporter ATP-binding protein [Aeromicrobium sp.]